MRAKAKAGIVMAVCVSALGLGGCANNPNTAAEVGSARITGSEVDSAHTALNEAGQRAAQASQTPVASFPKAVVLNILMRGEAAKQVAQQRGITVDQAKLDAEFNKFADAPDIAAFPEAKNLVLDSLTADQVSQQMGAEAFDKALQQIKVSTNPRYGVTGLEQLQQNPMTGELSLHDGSLSNLGSAKPQLNG